MAAHNDGSDVTRFVSDSCTNVQSGSSKHILEVWYSIKHALEEYSMSLTTIYRGYEDLIRSRPDVGQVVESSLRFFSFWLPGKMSSSDIATEALYLSCRGMATFHAHLRRPSARKENLPNNDLDLKNPKAKRISQILTVFDYISSLLELTAGKLFGEVGRLVLLIILQCCKVALRFLLLLVHKSKMLFYNEEEGLSSEEDGTESYHSWEGKRSGRLFRSLENKEGILRFDRVSFEELKRQSRCRTKEEALVHNAPPLWAEVLYAARPMVHIFSLLGLGEKSWKPWFIAILVECLSLGWIQQRKELLPRRMKDELQYRTLNILIYLLRNPFCEKITVPQLEKVEEGLQGSYPRISAVCRPLLEYLKMWKRIYTYCWATL